MGWSAPKYQFSGRPALGMVAHTYGSNIQKQYAHRTYARCSYHALRPVAPMGLMAHMGHEPRMASFGIVGSPARGPQLLFQMRNVRRHEHALVVCRPRRDLHSLTASASSHAAAGCFLSLTNWSASLPTFTRNCSLGRLLLAYTIVVVSALTVALNPFSREMTE